MCVFVLPTCGAASQGDGYVVCGKKVTVPWPRSVRLTSGVSIVLGMHLIHTYVVMGNYFSMA